jgi:hypothetical protein
MDELYLLLDMLETDVAPIEVGHSRIRRNVRT